MIAFWTFTLLLNYNHCIDLRGISTMPFTNEKIKNCSEARKYSEYMLGFVMIIAMNETKKRVGHGIRVHSIISSPLHTSGFAINIPFWWVKVRILWKVPWIYSVMILESVLLSLKSCCLFIYLLYWISGRILRFWGTVFQYKTEIIPIFKSFPWGLNKSIT